MKHYWTEPIKLTFNWVIEKRTTNGETLEKHEFDYKDMAECFLSQTNYYVNNKLVLTDKKFVPKDYYDTVENLKISKENFSIYTTRHKTKKIHTNEKIISFNLN